MEVMELVGYSRPTYNKLCASSHDVLDRHRSNPQAPQSTTFVDHSIDLPWRNFLSPKRVWGKFQREVSLFWRYPNFLTAQCNIGSREAPMPKPAVSVKSFRYNPGLWRTDRRTDGQTRDDSIMIMVIISRWSVGRRQRNQLFISTTLRSDSAVQCHLTAWLFCEGGGGVRFIPAWFLYFLLHSVIFSFPANWVPGST